LSILISACAKFLISLQASSGPACRSPRGLDQLAALFCLLAQRNELLHAILGHSSDLALRRCTEAASDRCHNIGPAHGRGAARCGRRTAIDGREGRIAGSADLPLSGQRRWKCTLRKDVSARNGESDGRKRRYQAAEGHSWIS
jgi:hypothetical protein